VSVGGKKCGRYKDSIRLSGRTNENTLFKGKTAGGRVKIRTGSWKNVPQSGRKGCRKEK